MLLMAPSPSTTTRFNMGATCALAQMQNANTSGNKRTVTSAAHYDMGAADWFEMMEARDGNARLFRSLRGRQPLHFLADLVNVFGGAGQFQVFSVSVVRGLLVLHF